MRSLYEVLEVNAYSGRSYVRLPACFISLITERIYIKLDIFHRIKFWFV
jgi:hypothetical protein